MATITTLVNGTPNDAGPVNDNFTAVNAELVAATAAIAALPAAGTADQVLRVPHSGAAAAYGNLHSATLISLGTGSATGRLLATGFLSNTTIGNVGGGEDTLHSWTMAANTIVSGGGLLIHSILQFASNANAKTLAFYIGATSVGLNPVTTAPNGVFAYLDVWAQHDGVSTFQIASRLSFGSGVTDVTALDASPVADITTALTVKFTAQGTSTNDLRQHITNIIVYRPPS
jgi:hypothetical protein